MNNVVGASEFTSWLNNMGAGTFIAIAICIITVTATATAKIKTIFDNHRKKVANETKKELENTELVDTVKTLADSVKILMDKVESIDKLHERVVPEVNELDNKVHTIDDLLELLIESNKTNIKSSIISEYQKWMSLEYIDIYSLSLIEEQFAEYEKFHGNTFVEDMVKQLRSLPKRPYIQDLEGNDPVGYFDKK